MFAIPLSRILLSIWLLAISAKKMCLPPSGNQHLDQPERLHSPASATEDVLWACSNFGSILKISINQTLFISSSCCFRVGCLTEFFCLVYSLEVVFIFHFFPVLICIDTGTVLNNEILFFSVSSHYRSALQLLTSTQVKSRRYFALLLVRSAIRFIGQALV